MKYLVIIFFLFIHLIYAQQVTIKGRVVDYYSNESIPGVNVLLKNSTTGTSTDLSGQFEINLTSLKNSILVFSHIAFEESQVSLSEENSTKDILIKLHGKVFSSQSILVEASMGKEGITPISFSKIKRSEIEKSYSVQDIPELLGSIPSVNYYSESGNSIGYNYLSIRGFDQRRISVSINGIPQNDPEDHNVYWVDFPDLIESTELIQVQRGAGSGAIGYPAIGGSVNIITSAFSDRPRFEISNSLGSYNSRKYSAIFSSGLVQNKYSVYAKLSQTLSSGYRDFSWSNLKSFHVSAARFDESLTSQINIYGGIISDGLAYTGLPKFAVKDKKLRRANYSYWSGDDKEYFYKLERRASEIENFFQPHFELLNELKINSKLKINSAFFLVIGNGFFDYDGSWADSNYFRMTKDNGINTALNPGNALIRAMVENKQWGWIPRVNIKHENGELNLGGELRFHNSLHWGSILFAENLPAGFDNNFRYYSYEGAKDIINFYINENYQLNNSINILAEIQISFNKYKLFNEKYLRNDFTINNTFLNSRFGLNYKWDESLSAYISYANVSREPRLKNYYDAAESSGGAVPQFAINSNGDYDFNKPLVQPESMHNVEIGLRYFTDDISLSLNGFLMLFNNEIVKQGQLDRFGQPVTGNMANTVHYGAEASLIYNLKKNFDFNLNASLSKNYISKGKTFIEYYNEALNNSVIVPLDLKDNPISGFPEMNLNASASFTFDNLYCQISGKYVSSFYTDNYGSNLFSYLRDYPAFQDYSENVVDAYFTANFYCSYDFKIPKVFENTKLFIQINNIFDTYYAAYGIGQEFFPAAERNLLAGVRVSL